MSAARARQLARFQGEGIRCNAEMEAGHLKKHCTLKGEAQDFLLQVFQRLGLSLRAYDRVLKVARTIADLAGEEEIGVRHLSEAVQYRCLDRHL